MSNSNQLFLLADHIKLSLLERQRAISLNLEPDSQDGHISRSLEAFRDGLEAVQKEQTRLEESGDSIGAENVRDTVESLQRQYNDLTTQFHGFAGSNPSASLLEPNDPSLASDFARASERPRVTSSSSFLKKSLRTSGPASPGLGSKSVRFSDTPHIQTVDPDDEANRNALFPYRDDPEGPPEQSHLDNQQIHAYHSQVIRDQDEQLDRLGESIGRQRELSIQIGNELDSHVQLLDEVDGLVERHQSRLDQAKKGLGKIMRKAGDNMQITTIIILIVILILLIALLK